MKITSLREQREKVALLSQRQMARLLGITEQALSLIEKLKQAPKVQLIPNLAWHYRTTVPQIQEWVLPPREYSKKKKHFSLPARQPIPPVTQPTEAK